MFCPQCGAPAPATARFCGRCGAQLPEAESPPGEPVDQTPAQQWAPQPPSYEPPGSQAPRSPAAAGQGRSAFKGRIALILSAVLVVLVAGGAAASYLLLHRTPKQLFFEVQRNYVAGLAAEIRSANKARLDLDRLTAEKPSQSRVVITGGTRGLDEADDLFDRSALELLMQTDPQAGVSSTAAALRLRGKDLISLELWQTPEELALRVPELEREYIVLENRGLRQFFRDRGFYGYAGPDRLDPENPLRTVLKENREEVSRLAADYARIVYDFIAEDEVTLEKGVRYNSPDGLVEADRLVLRLSEARVRQLLTDLAATFRNDSDAVDLLSEIVAAAAGNGAPELEDWQDPAYVRDQLLDGADDLLDWLQDASFPDGLTWTVYIDGRRLVDQTLDFTVRNKQEEFPVTVQMTDWGSREDKLVRKGKISLRPTDGRHYDDELIVQWRTATTAVASDKSVTEIDFSVAVYAGNMRTSGLHVTDTAETVRDVQKGKDRTTHDFTVRLSDYGDDVVFSGTMSILASNAVQNNRFEQDVALTLEVEPANPWDPAFDVELKISAATEVLQGRLNLPDLTGAKRLNDMSDREIDELLMDMEESLVRLIQRNMDLFLGF